MTNYNGRCHCGQTEWTVKLDEANHVLCHCQACKLLSGGEYTLNAIADKDNVKVTKGDLKTYTYHGDSGNAVRCSYCSNCTSHPFHHQEVMGPDKLVVRTIFLNGAKDFKAAAELYGKDRLSWQKEIDGATTFEAGPPS